MDGTKTRTSGGEILSSCRTAPLKPKSGLNGALVVTYAARQAGSQDAYCALFKLSGRTWECPALLGAADALLIKTAVIPELKT